MSFLIVGQGGPNDVSALRLQTRARWDIPNHQEKISTTLMKELHAEFERNHPRWRLRSLATGYNCLGMVFGSRRTWIEADHFMKIAVDDGFRRVNEVEVVAGDLVAYLQRGEVVHVAMVIEKCTDLAQGSFRFLVVSKLGKGPEYFHDHNDLPRNLENPPAAVQFWSERGAL